MISKKTNTVFLCLLCAILLGGFVALSFFPADRYSATEKRYLADLPTTDTASLFDGSYTAALDTYATERLPFRAPLRQAYAAFRILSGSQEAGDVLLCRDGSLAKRITINERLLFKNLKAIQQWKAQYGDALTVAVAPCRIMMREEVLPALYDTAENHRIWQTVAESCPYAVLFPELNRDDCWYRTDHHWTTKGAYLAYKSLGKALGYTPLAESAFEIETVCSTFYGTSHAAAGLPLIAADSVQLYRSTSEKDCRVEIDGASPAFSGFYDFEKLQSKDEYGIFFGGNHGVMTVEAQGERPRLLVIKDSFANALLPFLAEHYDLTVIDPRYTAKDLGGYIAQADRILLLCGMQTLCETAWIK